MNVSVFNNFASEGREVDLQYVFAKIRTGGDFVKSIEQIRELTQTDPESAQDLKKKLPGVTFCGVFTSRKSQNLIKSTGLLILDFDHVEEGIEEKLKADNFIYALWRSPRGEGFKALVKIPEVKDDNEFKSYFYAVQEHFPDVDPSGKDISRFCFISYDPHLFINESAETWTKQIEQGTEGYKDIPGVHNVKTNWKKMTIGLQMIDTAPVGNRNNTILKAGRLMGGFIATGEVNEIDVLDVFERAIDNKDPRDARENFRTFRRGIEYGKTNPVESTEIITEEKIGKIYYTLRDLEKDVDEIYEKGYTKGYDLGWEHFKENYSVKLGYTTYIYGAPSTGKSKWWFNALVNLSVRYGLRHAIYSPETGSASDVYAMLIQTFGGGDITNTFSNRMNKLTYTNAKNFIGEHFIIISTDETDTELEPCELLEYVDVIEKKFSTTVHTVTIDPWNELKHKMSRERDIYLSEQLKKVRVHAKKSNRHVCIITHIRDQKPLSYDETGTAIYPFPTERDVADGQVWNRKGFMMLSFYRHFVMDGYDAVKIGKDRYFHKNATLIRVQKFKPEGTGKRGEIEFRLNIKTHRYTDIMGRDADWKKDKPEVIGDDELPF